MPAPRIAEFQERPQLPIITAPSGLPFLGGAAEGSNEPGLGQEPRD